MLSLLLVLQLAPSMGADPVRIDRLRLWVDAVERHVPGEQDESARRVGAMHAAELERVRIDAGAVATLMRDPRATVFHSVSPERRQRAIPWPVQYSGDELRALRALAKELSARTGPDGLLKRAAVLHADLAMWGWAAEERASRTGIEPPLVRVTVFVDDGRQVALRSVVDHWEMGRRLLPGADDDVRLWYRATLAHLLSLQQIDQSHAAAALRLFPKDADTLFALGCVREKLAAPDSNEPLRSARGVTMDMGSAREELRAAEDLFRRALAADPRLAEARLRLGRVLGLLGRPADAVRELRAAVQTSPDPLVQYYGHLFLGRELDAVRDAAGARAAYERAAALAPRAPAPRLGLSHLAVRTGDRQAALASVRDAVSGEGIEEHDDPLWLYHPAAGREADALVAQMRVRLAPVTR